jgi:hypothetical protein
LARLAGAHDSFARAVLGRFDVQRDTAMADDFVRQGLPEALVHCPKGTGLEARLLAADAASCISRSPAERRVVLDNALEIARRNDEPETLAWVLKCVHWTVLDVTTPQLLALASEMVRAAQRAALPDVLMDGHLWKIGYLMRLGRPYAQEVELIEHERLARVYCDSFHQWHGGAARTALNLVRGDLETAEAVARRSYELGVTLDPLIADAILGGGLFMIGLQSEGAARVRLFREAKEIIASILARIPWFRTWAALESRAAAELGDTHTAEQQVPQLVEEALQAPLGPMHRLNSLAVLVPSACARRDSNLVLRIYESMQPFAGLAISVNYGTYFGQVNQHLAALAEALGHSQRAREHAHSAELELARMRPSGPRMRPPTTIGPGPLLALAD